MVLPEFYVLNRHNALRSQGLGTKDAFACTWTTYSLCIQAPCNNHDSFLRYDISNYPCKWYPAISHIATKLFRVTFRNGTRWHVDQDLCSSWNIGNTSSFRTRSENFDLSNRPSSFPFIPATVPMLLLLLLLLLLPLPLLLLRFLLAPFYPYSERLYNCRNWFPSPYLEEY